MNDVYITSQGIFLPGDPINNDMIEEILGLINEKPSRTKKRILNQNGIKTRFYAINEKQESLYTNSQMAAKAINNCINNSNVLYKDIDFLATATTQGDLPIPGFGSMVHGESEIGECEITSHQSVCSASMMAIKSAYQNIKLNEKQNAIACASEFASRLFKGSRYKNQKRKLTLEEDFLRWMLSDGAGSFLLQSKPSNNNISLKIEWLDIKSYAHHYDVCMYAGSNNPKKSYSWLDYNNFEEAALDGAINLRQNLKLVNNMVKIGVDHYFKLIDQKKFEVNEIDHLLCHYSSHSFKQPIIDLLKKGGGLIPENKWFTNLYSKGNTGTASIFIMLEEFISKKTPNHGDKILLMVPESGRFISSYMLCTVLYPNNNNDIDTNEILISAPKLNIGNTKNQEWIVRQLTKVWIEFEARLNKIPIVKKINNNTLSLSDYRRLLLNLRQQVMDGAQWIARAASNVDINFFDSRSAFITHAREEHKDFRILEKNYVECGGKLEDIQNADKNIGSEALSAWMFQRASQPNPFDLLGSMFIIEGMGNSIAGNWANKIQKQLNLNNDQISFLSYHSSADENHFERLEQALSSDLLTKNIATKIVKTAKVTARLYLLQLEELDKF